MSQSVTDECSSSAACFRETREECDQASSSLDPPLCHRWPWPTLVIMCPQCPEYTPIELGWPSAPFLARQDREEVKILILSIEGSTQLETRRDWFRTIYRNLIATRLSQFVTARNAFEWLLGSGMFTMCCLLSVCIITRPVCQHLGKQGGAVESGVGSTLTQLTALSNTRHSGELLAASP